MLLSKEGAHMHGVTARRDKVICMLLLQKSQDSTLSLNNLTIFGAIIAIQRNLVSPVYMTSTSQTASSNRQALKPSLNCKRLPETRSWQCLLRRLQDLNHCSYVQETTP